MVLHALPNRATRDICIRRCPNSPLKIQSLGEMILLYSVSERSRKKQDERLHAEHDAELPEARQKQRPERRAEHERDHRRVEDERNDKAVYKRGEDAAGELQAPVIKRSAEDRAADGGRDGEAGKYAPVGNSSEPTRSPSPAQTAVQPGRRACRRPSPRQSRGRSSSAAC